MPDESNPPPAQNDIPVNAGPQPPDLHFPGLGSPPPEPKPEPAPEPEPTRAIVDAFAKRGYDVSGFGSDEDFLPHLEQAYSQVGRLEQLERLAAVGREALEAREQEKAPPKKETKEEPKSDWDPPEYNPQWEALCEADPRLGQYVVREEWRSTVAPSVAEKLTKYRQWENDALRRMVQQFPSLVEKYAAKIVQDQTKDLSQQWRADYEQERALSEAERYFQDRNHEFYQMDGGAARYNASGEPILTERGQALAKYMQAFRDAGVDDQVKLSRIAMQWAKEHPAAEPPAEKSPAKPKAQEKVKPPQTEPPKEPDDTLRRAIRQAEHTADRDANALAIGTKTDPSLDFGAMLRQDMREAGFLPETG